MIDEVLKEIKICEDKADEMQRQAYLDGKKIVLDAETEAERQKKATIAECKQDIKEAQLKAEKKASERRAKVLADGEKKAQELIDSKHSEIHEVSDKIVNMLLEKY